MITPPEYLARVFEEAYKLIQTGFIIYIGIMGVCAAITTGASIYNSRRDARNARANHLEKSVVKPK